MTKVQTSLDLTLTDSDAKFRAWGLACSDALVACGLVRTADTGQISWTTVTKPTTGASVKAGYEVYRFADTLQATKPVFIRVDYGTGAAGVNTPGTWFNVGTATDGAGTMTGVNIGPKQSCIGTLAAMNNGAAPGFFTHSLTSGYLLACFGVGLDLTSGGSASNTHAGVLIVERIKDSTGAVTGSGVGITVWDALSPSVPKDYAINFDAAVGYSTGRNVHCGVANTGASMSSGTDIALYRHYIGAGALFPAIGRLSHWTGDIINGAQFSATPVGTTLRNYYCWSGAQNGDSASTPSIILDWLWED